MLAVLGRAKAFIGGETEHEVNPNALDCETSILRFIFTDTHKIAWTYFDLETAANTTFTKEITRAKFEQIKRAMIKLWVAGKASTEDRGITYTVNTNDMTRAIKAEQGA